MPIGPEGTVVEGSASDDETGGAVGGAERERGAGEHGGTNPVGGAGARPSQGMPSSIPRSYR